LIAALYHTFNHAMFKGLLFLGAGSVVQAMHTRNMEKMGGLIRHMPVTACASWWARWPSPGFLR
jgi:hydrogenase-4 component B